MTPIRDAEYIREVTQCLSKSIADVLRTRPEDPIAYIAQCLCTHRRNHPRETTEKYELPVGDDSATSDLVKSSEQEKPFRDEEVHKSDVTPSEIARKNLTLGMGNMRHTITAGSTEDEDLDLSLHDNQFSDVNFVHKEFRTALLAFGDLFDNDDFG